jgi:hypothetical protein
VVYETEGHRFESCRARLKKAPLRRGFSSFLAPSRACRKLGGVSEGVSIPLLIPAAHRIALLSAGSSSVRPCRAQLPEVPVTIGCQ